MTKTSTGGKAIAFLDAQRLAHTPANYHAAYAYVTKSDAAMAKAIDDVVDGGVRITQAEVDAILARCGVQRGGGEGDPGEAARTRHQMLRLAEIADETTRTAATFGNDMLGDIDAITCGGDAIGIARGMASRAELAEAALAATRRQLDQVRQDLEAARDDASRDALTGLPNRRAFEARLATLGGTDRSIAFLDLDRFKSINDTYGHGVGDRVLKHAAKILQETCGEHMVARWGGEEFVIAFAGLDRDRAAAIVDGARIELGNRNIKLRETDQPLGRITFSAGVSDLADDAHAIKEADELVYAAKDAGRDQVLRRRPTASAA